jgi:hypothetical protein
MIDVERGEHSSFISGSSDVPKPLLVSWNIGLEHAVLPGDTSAIAAAVPRAN